MHMSFRQLALAGLAFLAAAGTSEAGSIFLTGHDSDFHAASGPGVVDSIGAVHINQTAIDFILDPAFNTFFAGGVEKFLYVQSAIAPPGGHRDGKNGIAVSGYTEGVDFDHVTAAGLNAALDQLGTTYSGIVIASDFGGILTQAELDILNARSADIIDFLNDGGGLFAMAEGNSGAGLTPGGGWFGYLPFVVSSTAFNTAESGATVTAFGASLGLTDSDVSSNFSHNIFTTTGGLSVVDVLPGNLILSLAGRGIIDPGTGISVPEPAMLALFGFGVLGLAAIRRRI